MMIRKLVVSTIAALSFSLANAQGVPVYDNAANIALLQQVVSAGQQLAQLQQQYQQLQQTFNALNGLRNISSLLSNPLLSQMLPPDIATTINSLRNGNVTGSLAGISGNLQQLAHQNAKIDCQNQFGPNSASYYSCVNKWQQASFASYVGQQGYDQSAQNISNLQQFLSAIQTSPDPKSLQDLQARISLEQVKQQNEAIKLKGIEMMQQAQEKMDRQNAVQSTQQMMLTGQGIRF